MIELRRTEESETHIHFNKWLNLEGFSLTSQWQNQQSKPLWILMSFLPFKHMICLFTVLLWNWPNIPALFSVLTYWYFYLCYKPFNCLQMCKFSNLDHHSLNSTRFHIVVRKIRIIFILNFINVVPSRSCTIKYIPSIYKHW